ncbi:hypothetical protein JR316_0010584 [Psilocybe cubensis]|uniref:Transmembrane protein n=2 Tax=Psilocybe cubensis TaxID=181762 RepID=A0A8H8CJX6_PSICU|nr:hypothetical protein JR316_0010584 [Psilocybe cubensis]KAH9476670.1 hypothetical protein JR316_0010584 [Psilocybe cubensis]
MSAPIASTSSSSNFDLEAQSPVSPVPVLTHSTWTAPPMHMLDPTDEQFGYTFSTHDSRHDERRQSLSDVPPPYAEESAIPLPEYTLHAPEPVTLAMFLFKFGFLFPPFWLFGAFILLSPLREPSQPSSDEDTPAWMPEKTEEERREIIATIRTTELKWARRCLCAFCILTVLAVGGGITAWAILRRS